MPKVTITGIRPLAGDLGQKSKPGHNESSAIFYCLLLSFTIGVSATPAAGAGDFKHARKLYVPPTQIERRVDFASLREHQAAIQMHSPAVSPSGTLSATGKYGLIPPPPPTTPSLTTGSLALPPPLPSYALSGARVAALKGAARKALSSPTLSTAVKAIQNKAAELSKEGKLEEAQQMLSRALKLSPKDTAVLKQAAAISLERAREFMSSSDFESAVKSARQALSLDSATPEAHTVLNQLLTRSGINPTDAAQRLKAADLLASQGKNEEAAVEYQSALELKPSAQAHIGLGNMSLRANHKETARKQYQQAIDLEANSAAAHRQMGLLRYSAGDVVGANAALSRALILDPQDETAGKTLVELWQHQVSKIPGANSHLGLARAYQLAGDLKSAQAEYRTVVRIDPENPNLPAARQAFKLALSRQEADRAVEAAHTLESQGALSPACQKASEAVFLSPGDAAIRLYQGQLLEKLGQTAAARDAYMNVLRDDPHNILAASRLQALPEEHPQLPAAPAQTAPLQTTPPLAAARENPALGIPPSGKLPSHDPVTNISGFALALRNQMMVNKSQIDKIEDAAHKIISQIGGTPSAEELHSAAPPGVAQAAAGAPSAPPATNTAAPAGMPASVASALSSAASALSAVKGLGITPAQAATPPATPAESGAFSAASPAVSAAPASPAANPAAATDTNLLSSFPQLNSAYKHLLNLQQQNKKLQEQINKMNQAIQRLRTNNTPAIAAESIPLASPDPSPALIPQVAPPPVAPPIQPRPYNAAPYAQSAPCTPVSNPQLPDSVNPLQSAAPAYLPYTNNQPSALSQAAVRLELSGAQPRLDGVHLDVVLKNDADSPLSVPSRLKAIIKYSNRKDAEVKVAFARGNVPAHGEMHGTIKVPFDKVDPSADLLIENLLPAGNGSRDVHLTTSISLR